LPLSFFFFFPFFPFFFLSRSSFIVAAVPLPGNTSLSRCSSTASRSSLRQVTNQMFNSPLTVASSSNRTTSGSVPIVPLRVNSTNTLGIVAENSKVCRPRSGLGIDEQIVLICSAKPNSKSRSASSRNNTSVRWSEKVGISDRWCASRPGVATITFGRLDSSDNCFSIDSPPLIPTALRGESNVNFRRMRSVCWDSSLVGLSIAAPTPFPVVCGIVPEVVVHHHPFDPAAVLDILSQQSVHRLAQCVSDGEIFVPSEAGTNERVDADLVRGEGQDPID